MYKILPAKLIKGADLDTIKNEPIASIDLMERASLACVNWIIERFPKEKFTFHVFVGPGNNGGDGLAIGRLLSDSGYKVKATIINFSGQYSENFNTNLKRLQSLIDVEGLKDGDPLSEIDSNSVIIDAILGSGISRAPKEWLAKIIQKINSFTNPIISIDLPSGLFADTSSIDHSQSIIQSNITLTLGAHKLALFMPENEKFTGTWYFIPIGLREEFLIKVKNHISLTEERDISNIFPDRRKFSHKGDFGHALLICGGIGKMGAAVLAAKACLRSGCGLSTVHTPKQVSHIIQSTAPEAMTSADPNDEYISTLPLLANFSSICFGMGCGKEEITAKTLKNLIQNYSLPILLDADALNILAENKTWLAFLTKNSILTPHIGEFKRLAGKSDNDFERLEKARQLAVKHQIILVLKGAYTAICSPLGQIYFNPNGNPGMAKGGSGDILSGLITGLLARGISPIESALAGVYLHGLAGDIAAEKYSIEAMTSGDIIEMLPEAWKDLIS